MSQRRLFVTTACAVAALLATTLPAQAQNIKQRTLKFSYVLAPETALGEGARKFADLVKTRSGGKIEIKQFPNGVLGGDAAMMSSLQGGTVDFTAVTAGLLYGHVKSYVVLDIPFQFNSVKEADAVVDGPLGKKLSEQLPAKGLIGLAFWEYGYRCLSNSKKPVAKVEDLAGMKIRVIQAPIYIETFNALGANSVPMPLPELYTALEQKAVDGQENPLNVIFNNRYGEVQKYVSLTRHIYNPLQLLMSKKTWDSMSDDEKKIISESAREAGLFQRAVSRKQDEQALEALKKQGVLVNDVTPEERTRMRDKAKPVIDKFSAEAGPELMKLVKDGIASANAAPAAPAAPAKADPKAKPAAKSEPKKT